MSTSEVSSHDNSSSGSGLFCNACAVTIDTVAQRLEHYRTEWHRYNVKRRCAGLTPITLEIFETKLLELQKLKQDENATFKCDICKKSFNSQAALTRHFQSKKHKKKAVVFESHPEKFQQAEAEAPNAEPVQNQESKDASMDTEENEEENKQSIPLKTCLFCVRKFTQLQASLNHMLKEHGFFIPYVEYLNDLEGLLIYLGEKVALGRMCLYCNGRGRLAYPSLRSAQQHMIDKGHCKIRLDDEEDEEELLDFYRFPSQEMDEDEDIDADNDNGDIQDATEDVKSDVTKHTKESSTASRGRRRATGITDNGELVLNDGTHIGHRSLTLYYKQNLKPESKNDRLIKQMMNEYRALQVPGYQQKSRRSEFTQKIVNFYKKKDLVVGMKSNFQKHYRKQVRV